MNTDRHTALLMVRHGQSTWNVEQRWQGQADPPLSDHGREQAFHAARSVGEVDAIIASPQDRATETAMIISEALGVGPVQLLDGLEERHVGLWSGRTTAEIEAEWPGWIDEPRRPDGWEQDDVVLARALAAIDRIVTEFAGGTVLVVSHGGIIVTLEDHLGVREGRIPNLHGRVVEHAGDTLRPGDRLELISPELSTGGAGRNRL